jgi:hypothetical protein
MGQPGGAPMQNMGGPPMGQMGMMPRPPMRQGTSKIVPVVVSAGLAVGVFCGLLFGLGTGKRSDAAPQKVSNNAKRDDDTGFTPESLANPNVKIPDKNAPKAGSNAGSNAVAKGSGDAAGSAEPVIKPTKLTVEIKPETAAQGAKVLIDGKPIDGMSTDIALDPGATKKTVKVLVKANGFKDVEQEVDVEGESVTVKLELSKGRSSTSAAQTAGGGENATASGGGHTTAGGGTGGGSTSGASGGGTGGGSKSSGGSKTDSKSGKSGKSGKGSGGLIDI